VGSGGRFFCNAATRVGFGVGGRRSVSSHGRTLERRWPWLADFLRGVTRLDAVDLN
jgi:hypothetical protein